MTRYAFVDAWWQETEQIRGAEMEWDDAKKKKTLWIQRGGREV
jgi:hypothetical protein